MQRNIFIALGVVLVVIVAIGASSLPSSNTETTKEEAWGIFERYMQFAMDKDLEGIKSLSHQTSDTCLNAELAKECEALMESAYVYGKDLKESDFTHIQQDSKQIILSTDFIRNEFSTTTLGYTRGVIYMTKDSSGTPKLLSFNPDDGVIIGIEGLDSAEIEEKIGSLIRDSDEDGLVDNLETCIDYENQECPTKGDPNNKDTNSNGWWDGIEIFFKQSL